MPRYFFDCKVSGKWAQDEDGVELSGPFAVEAEALRSAWAIACDEFPCHDGNGEVVIAAKDEHGEPVVTVRTTMATSIERWSSGAERDSEAAR
jgi:hypothetical protein